MGWIARHWRWTLFSAVTAILVAIVAPIDYHDRDFAGFWLGSRMLLEGRDPYDPAVWLPALRLTAPHLAAVAPPGTGYGYPLWTATLTVPFALLPFDVASRGWLGSQTFLGLVGMGGLLSVLGILSRPSEMVLLVAMLVTSQAASMLEEVANVQGFVLAILSVALALLLDAHAFAAGIVLGLLILKPHLFLFFLPALLLATPQRARVASGMAVSAALLLLVSVLVRPSWIGEFATTVSRVDTTIGPRGTAWSLGPMLGVPGVVPVVLALAAFGVWWSTKPPRPLLYAAALPISLFVAPYAGRYDALALFASLAIAVAALHAAVPSARAVALVLIVIVASPLPWFLHLLVLVNVNEAVGSLVPLATFATILLSDRYARAGAPAVAPS